MAPENQDLCFFGQVLWLGLGAERQNLAVKLKKSSQEITEIVFSLQILVVLSSRNEDFYFYSRADFVASWFGCRKAELESERFSLVQKCGQERLKLFSSSKCYWVLAFGKSRFVSFLGRFCGLFWVQKGRIWLREL